MRVSRQLRAVSRVLLVLLVLGLASGCSFFGKKKADPLETLSVEQLYERGKNFKIQVFWAVKKLGELITFLFSLFDVF